jgi:hypothetical protein
MSDGLVQILVRHRRLLLMGPPPAPATSNPTSPTVQLTGTSPGSPAELAAMSSPPDYTEHATGPCP